MNPFNVVLIVLVVLVVLYVLRGIKIVSQSETMIVERLGKYNRTLNAGINVIFDVRTALWRVLRELICESKCMTLTNKVLSQKIM